ncbi:unnamed protein product [Ranitomeya imitator]|uniref:MANSC domain-containing protein n=1 Tax=Ranitomeya imitator TaxID=111125 RepID=A0ABN9LRK7_9NEOB|nr:unnamed protein product [Ranitomeya imitator]
MRLLVTIAAMVASIWLVCSELQGQSCLDNFTNMPNFVLDLNDSVSSGATFLTAPALDRVRDCLTACCRSPSCNVALVERDPGHDDIIHSCFLLNCVYKQEFVCKFVRKEGFSNYVTVDVSKKYLHRWEEQEGLQTKGPVTHSDAAAIPTTIRIAAASLESCRTDSSPATNDPEVPGNQGKLRVTKRRAALSNPMFTLVTIVKVKKKQTVHTYLPLAGCEHSGRKAER